MKPYYQDKWVTIYHGDCREILPELDVKVDLVLTDPPYGIGFSEYLNYNDNPSGYGDFVWPICELAEMLIQEGWMCVFQAAKKCREWHTIFPREYRLVACPKTFVQIFKVTGMTWATDYALVWPIGAPPQIGKGRDWFVSDTANMQFDRGHPCARPLAQIRYLIENLSEPGNMVLDPFLGSGTTVRAAKDLNRHSIGIEIEEKYCEIAARRCSQEVMELV